MTEPRKIVTTHVFPPIPVRSFDWCAHYDGDEPDSPRGWGSTEKEAIESLADAGVCSHCGKIEGEVHGCCVGGCPLGEDA